MVFSSTLNSTANTSSYTPEVIASRFFFFEVSLHKRVKFCAASKLLNLLCLFQAYITWNSSNVAYVPPSHPYTCMASALAPAPSAVDTLAVVPYFTDGPEVTLQLTWSPPAILNGDLSSFDVCIGSIPLDPHEEIVADGRHECSTSIVRHNS